ncbi:hypothetical protein [Flagellimonas meridianipacifica]|uniref:Outer membrane protein with beta-barrel domain n=1 Tax=Flagellimonas meridianipacifica TaxID=1080225 RepID=A0A2T0MDB0_9FLAO|nr:hypothetical protein [Allomuricauda pacifica]PRX55477.1 hypothetical protein CLV81_3890 [Allomuricauda pacifica]
MTFPNFKHTITVILIGIHFSYGQTNGKVSGVEEKPKISIDGHRYPTFGDKSNFADFEMHFPLTETSEISVGGVHYRTLFADRFTVPVQYKKYFAKKLYLIGGYRLEWDLLNDGAGKPNPTPLQEAFFGVGHEVKPNMFLETRFAQPIGNPTFNKLGFDVGQPILEFGGKLKF